jgi:hypothetical protein
MYCVAFRNVFELFSGSFWRFEEEMMKVKIGCGVLTAVMLSTYAVPERRISEDTDALGFEVKVSEAAFTVRHQYGQGWALAPKGAKLLILKYAVKNTSPTPLEYSRESVSIAVRRGNGERQISISAPARLLGTPVMELAPGKTLEDMTWLEVPNDDEKPTVVVRMNGVERSLPIPAKIDNQLGVFGKPGTLVALDEVETTKIENLRVGAWNFGLGKVSYSDRAPSFRVQAPPLHGYAVVPVKFENPLRSSQALSSYALNWEGICAGGKVAKWSRSLLNAKGEPFEAEVPPGRASSGQLVFFVPAKERIVGIRATDPSSGRSIVFRMP